MHNPLSANSFRIVFNTKFAITVSFSETFFQPAERKAQAGRELLAEVVFISWQR